MTAVGDLSSVLHTKLYRPPLMGDFVLRQRLYDRLDLITQYPLTLVSAPAGFGKSTLVSAWLEQCACPSAWLSLDPEDSDPGSFQTYVLAALRTVDADLGRNWLAALESVSLPSTRAFVTSILEDIALEDSHLVLVLDDYSVITNDAVHHFVREVMRHPHPRLHLVLTARHDPPLPLNEWRASGQLLEVRGGELRFSVSETARFLELALSVPVDAAAVAVLNQKTEGWIAGLRLAVLSLSHGGTFGEFEDLSGSNLFIREYLISQVLDQLPTETQMFLVQSSVLDRLSAELCREVIDLAVSVADMQAVLNELEAANIFLIPLDDSGRWYRYHHLFREFLASRLTQGYSASELTALHLRAGAWFAENDFLEEALRHTLAAGDMASAVELVATHRYDLINQESYRRLSRWLSMFPESVIEESPDLLLIKARFAQTVRVDILELYQLVQKIDALLARLDLEPERARLLAAENNALRSAALMYISPDPQDCLTCCETALQALPGEWHIIRSYCWMFGAVALQLLGDHAGVQAWLNQAKREDMNAVGGPRARNVAAEGFVAWMAADLARLQQVGELMIGFDTEAAYWETQGWGNHFLAIAHYFRNDLEHAERHARSTFDNRHYHPSANVDSAVLLAMILQADGRPQEAREMLAKGMEFAGELHSLAFAALVQSFQVELAFLQGRAYEVGQWAEHAAANLQVGPQIAFYAPALTVPKVLLATDTADSRALAAETLTQLRAFAESRHQTRMLIEILALEAQLHAANGDEAAAISALEESLALALPSGFVRLYVDLGSKIASLLRRIPNREPYAAYVAAILSAFGDTAFTDRQRRGSEQLIEPLTEREAEILELLGRRYSNKEIAAELVISQVTVKRHVSNIFQKLAVHSRRDAVDKAITLGLLPPPL